MVSSLLLPRTVLVAGLLVLALGACGRRGALEAPPDPSATQKPAAKQAAAQPAGQAAQPAGQAAGPGQTDEEEEDATLPSPVGTPRRSNAKRGYVIPKEP